MLLVAVRCLQRALDIYVEAGRFSVAAKAEKDIAEVFEAEGNLTEVRCGSLEDNSSFFLGRFFFFFFPSFFFSLRC